MKNAGTHASDRTSVSSTWIDASKGSSMCLSFWVSMSGKLIGTLNVYLRDKITGRSGPPVWYAKGECLASGIDSSPSE